MGGLAEKYIELAKTFYEHIYGVHVIKVSNLKTVNAAKIIKNVFRDVNIALMNKPAVLHKALTWIGIGRHTRLLRPVHLNGFSYHIIQALA